MFAAFGERRATDFPMATVVVSGVCLVTSPCAVLHGSGCLGRLPTSQRNRRSRQRPHRRHHEHQGAGG